MKLTLFFLITILLIPYQPTVAHSGDFHNSLSFQGYTGLLNIPNAEVTNEGTMHFMFSNQVEQSRRKYDKAENYVISLGLLPYLEFCGRLTEEEPKGMRDLSANIKIQMPFFHRRKYLPELAFGVQDLGGGSSHLRTTYAVMSKEVWPFRFTVGKGMGPDRMDGLFGGLEIQVFDWIYLMGEHDAQEKNVGIRIITPDNWLYYPVNLELTAKTSMDYEKGNFDLSFALRVPIGLNHNDSKTLPDKKAIKIRRFPRASKKMSEDVEKQLLDLKDKLVKLGFENLKAGVKGDDTLFIEYENNTYNHNELDGLGLVLGVSAIKAPPSLTTIIVVLKEMNIPMMEITTSIYAYKEFLIGEDRSLLYESLKISKNISTSDYAGIKLVGGDDNLGRLRARLIIMPGLQSYIGWDYGVFDYLLSIKPDTYLPLWKGCALNARWDIPVAWSDSFDDGGYHRDNRKGSELDRLMIHQSFKVMPDLMTLFSAGMFLPDRNGMLNDTIWDPGTGHHRFRLRSGYIDDKDAGFTRKTCVGSYRYYLQPLDLYFESLYGRYWEEDKGIRFELKRFFGDTSISLFYKSIGKEEGESAAGVNISFPLTPRRDMKPSFVQVKGTDRWSYGIETTIAKDSERNPIADNLAIFPQTDHNLERVYYNDGRLDETYIKRHVLRLRDAYFSWGTDVDDTDG